MQIRWSDAAHADVLALRDYIARDSPYYARRFSERLLNRSIASPTSLAWAAVSRKPTATMFES
jgi:plasmid stabilization system protein ParE